MENAQFQVYTGNGKGKTTAALGLTLRAVGAGLSVYFCQFIKDMEYSEITMLKKNGVTVEQFGTGEGCLIGRDQKEKDVQCAQKGVERLKEVLLSEQYDVVVADEINVAYMLGLLSKEDWCTCAKCRSEHTELIFTGRGAPDCAQDMADLMTEMREVKHYYNTKKLFARLGIEK